MAGLTIEASARNWRKERNRNWGVVIFYAGILQGWQNELRTPQHWRPGCIAIDEAGNSWESRGGNDRDGSERWEPVR